MSEPSSTNITLRADAAAVETALAELFAAVEVLDHVPESLRGALGALRSNLRDEITVTHDPAASSAGELVVRLGIVSGGRFERCLAAVRALRVEIANGSGHEGLPSSESDGCTPDSTRGERPS